MFFTGWTQGPGGFMIPPQNQPTLDLVEDQRDARILAWKRYQRGTRFLAWFSKLPGPETWDRQP